MEVVDADSLSGMLSAERLSAFHAGVSVLNGLDVHCWMRGVCFNVEFQRLLITLDRLHQREDHK